MALFFQWLVVAQAALVHGLVVLFLMVGPAEVFPVLVKQEI